MTDDPTKEPEGDMFGPFKDQGWSAIAGMTDGAAPANLSPEQVAAFEEQQQREYDLNKAIHAVFSSPEGQTVFEFFREIATEGQRFDVVNETDAALAAAKGFFREGQAAMYFEFKRRMNAAMQGPPAV
jgi:hypothetical protein